MSVQVDVEITLHNQTQHTKVDETDLFNDVMNIFVLSSDPVECAQMLCDKHVCKLSIEYVQILCSARHLTDWRQGAPVNAYKLTHKYHPAVRWAQDSLMNYLWLLELTRATWKEYKYRYSRDHKCSTLDSIVNASPVSGINGMSTHTTTATPPPQCVPDIYRVPQTEKNFRRWDNAVAAYRNYYVHEKYSFAKWTNREPPEWFIKETRDFESELGSVDVMRHVHAHTL
jgi:hypothetical protein